MCLSVCVCVCVCVCERERERERMKARLSKGASQPRVRSLSFVVQLSSRVQLFVTPWTTAPQASLSFIISLSLFKLMSIESVMPSNHLILCHPLLLPSILPSLRVFSSDLALYIRWPKYWSFSISPCNEYLDYHE